LRRKLLFGAAVFVLVACGDEATADEEELKKTRVEVVSDWYDEPDDDTEVEEREVIVNGRHCIEVHEPDWGNGPGLGISCEWGTR
jgi:hypothetical protein